MNTQMAAAHRRGLIVKTKRPVTAAQREADALHDAMTDRRATGRRRTPRVVRLRQVLDTLERLRADAGTA